MKPKCVLITGTSSGLGKELVHTLSEAGFFVIATARLKSVETAKKAFKLLKNVVVYPLDITQMHTHKSFISQMVMAHGAIDILINNAGIAYRSVFEHISEEEENHQMTTNYLGAMELTRCVIPFMREKKSGHIINVSSVGGMMAMPTMAAYCASKFALEGATESLWYELRPWNIYVSLVEIGFVKSKSFTHIYFPKQYLSGLDNTYDLYYKHMERFVAKMMLSSPSTPHTISKRILKKLILRKHPPLRLSGTWDAKFFFYMRRYIPRRLYHYILYKCLPGIKEWERNARNDK